MPTSSTPRPTGSLKTLKRPGSFCGGRRALWQGDRIVQTDLAATLEAIAKNGPDAFYRGPVAAAVEKASRAHGGILTARDFAGYTAIEGSPLNCTYRGYVLLSAPPPSSGGVAIWEILTILEGYDIEGSGFRSARSIHLMVEAMPALFATATPY